MMLDVLILKWEGIWQKMNDMEKYMNYFYDFYIFMGSCLKLH